MVGTSLQTRYGPLSIPDTADDMISRFLKRYGEWAFLEARFISLNLPDGARLLDVGAFLGTFSLGVTALRPLSSVCLVEANPHIIPYLTANLAECPAPFALVNALVSGTGTAPATPLRAWHLPGNLSSLSFLPDDDVQAHEEVTVCVPSTGLASIRAEHGPFDAIKIDAEGMELGILDGDPEFLSSSSAAIWVECNEHPRSLTLASALLHAGFRVFYFAFPAFSSDNFRRDPDPIFPFSYEAGLYCSRDGLPRLDDGLRAEGCVLTQIGDVADLRRAMWQTPRGGPREWLGLSREAVVAVAGHALRHESLETYLQPRLAAEPEAAEPDEPAESEPEPLSVQPLLDEIAQQQRRIEELETELALSSAEETVLRANIVDLSEQLRHQATAMSRLQAAHARVAALADGRGVLLAAARERLGSVAAQQTDQAPDDGRRCVPNDQT
jgi:FkbM family methyltransferase